MFTSEGLQFWLERNQIPETTRSIIEAIRTSGITRTATTVPVRDSQEAGLQGSGRAS
jgi:hypothetical protein